MPTRLPTPVSLPQERRPCSSHGGNTRAYTSGDKRTGDFWDTYIVSFQRPLLQDQEIKPTCQRYRNKKSQLGKMREQKNRFQLKELDQTPGEKLSEMFKVMIIKMLKDFERRVDVHSVKLQSQSRENLQTIQV